MNIVPTNDPSIYDILNTLVVNQQTFAIVRPDNPPPGIAGFLFDVVEDDSSDLESDITDYFIEDNSSIQDHIALKPETVSISGRVAELVQAVVTTKPTVQRGNPLPLVPGLNPTLTPQAEQTEVAVQEQTAQDKAAITSTDSLWGYYKARSPQQSNQTKQSYIYGYFYQLWKGRQLCTVETPWGFFTNMAIQSISATQGAETRTVSAFTISFKKIRTATSVVINPGARAGRSQGQASTVVSSGFLGQQPLTLLRTTQIIQQIRNPTQ
jgi:hypothetical protein